MEATLKNKALVFLFILKEGLPPAWQGQFGQVQALAFLTGATEAECEKAFMDNADDGLADVVV